MILLRMAYGGQATRERTSPSVETAEDRAGKMPFPDAQDSWKCFVRQPVRVAHFCEDFTTDGRDDTDFFEQGTKETKEEFFFVALVRFCANSVPMAVRMEDSESVKSVKSVVQFLWLHLAALRSVLLFKSCASAISPLRPPWSCGLPPLDQREPGPRGKAALEARMICERPESLKRTIEDLAGAKD